jgi:hypothetical protein
MVDSLFTGVLVFGLMVSGAVAFGSEFAARQPQAGAPAALIVTLPSASIVGHRHVSPVVRLASI